MPSSRGFFPTQGSNSSLPHCRQILYCLSHQGNPRILECVSYLSSRGSSQPRNWTQVSPELHVNSLPAELPRKSSKYCTYINSFTGHLDNPMMEALVMSIISSLQMRPGEGAGYLPPVRGELRGEPRQVRVSHPPCCVLVMTSLRKTVKGEHPGETWKACSWVGAVGPLPSGWGTTTDIASNGAWQPEEKARGREGHQKEKEGRREREREGLGPKELSARPLPGPERTATAEWWSLRTVWLLH